MTYEEVFNEVKQMLAEADVHDVQEHIVCQCNIEGEAEGIFYIEVKEGKLYVEPYEYHDRNALFRAKAKTLLGIMKGQEDPVIAFTFGTLKVEGNLGKAITLAQLLQRSKKA